jgi:hypothetical protein
LKFIVDGVHCSTPAATACHNLFSVDIGYWHLSTIQYDPINGFVVSVFRSAEGVNGPKFMTNNYFKNENMTTVSLLFVETAT